MGKPHVLCSSVQTSAVYRGIQTWRYLPHHFMATPPISQSNLKRPWEPGNYPLLSPGSRNEGLTHRHCLEGPIAVQSERRLLSDSHLSPLVSLNHAKPHTLRRFMSKPECRYLPLQGTLPRSQKKRSMMGLPRNSCAHAWHNYRAYAQ